MTITATQKAIPFDVLTTELLDKLPKSEIFATGILLDNQYGLNMTNSGHEIRWVAATGQIGDWCVYVSWAYESPFRVQETGDKVISRENILHCFKFDDAAWARYRF